MSADKGQKDDGKRRQIIDAKKSDQVIGRHRGRDNQGSVIPSSADWHQDKGNRYMEIVCSLGTDSLSQSSRLYAGNGERLVLFMYSVAGASCSAST